MVRFDARIFDAWIFDLDGTLAVARHDFAALKSRLGLPPELPILEGIARKPVPEQPALLDAVDQWEQELADGSVPNDGAIELLETLAERGSPMGILTRNTRATALRTLLAAGLRRFFPDERVFGRAEASPKPSPDGVLDLAALFGIPPHRIAVVGDHRMDLEAGKAAGACAIWLDVGRSRRFLSFADHVVNSLSDLRERLTLD